MFWRRVDTSASLDAQIVKTGGVWRRLTWSQVGAIVREAALGLMALGRRPADVVALLSASRAEWVQADFAIQSAGGITVPIYPTSTGPQIAHIVNDARARTLIVEGPAELARVVEVRARMPLLEQVLVFEGDAGAAGAPVLTWSELRRLGRDHAGRLGGQLAERIASVRPDDIATIVYTSGTTGEPKGVVQTHGNYMASLDALARIPGVRPGDVHLLFLPLAHAFARLEAFLGVHRRLVTAFAESLDRVADNLREVQPDFVFGVPRLFEKVRERVLAGVEAGPAWRRRVFAWAMKTGLDVSRRAQARRPIPGLLELRRRLAHRAVFARLHQAFGGRLRFAVAGGAPLARDVAEFFHAAGLLIVEGYGLTETCPVLTFNRLDHFKFGSVGQAISGVELAIAPDGEILARGPNVATRGYLNLPEATREAFLPDGWLHTGDIGHIDEEGFVHVTDRKKELIVTSGGANIAPQPIESRLRLDPLVSQAMVCGDRRPYPAALITLSHPEVMRFAAARGIMAVDHARLLEHPAVIARVQQAVDAVNAELQSYARIKRFALLPGDFTEAAGELTPTQKVKRKVVAEKYGAIIESLYRQASEAS
jgi:long-chain acyl-CoA synthetase